MHKKTAQIVATVVFVFLSILCVVPLLLVVVSSFTSEKALYTYGYSLFPSEVSTGAYQYLLASKDKLLRSYNLSFLVTAVGTLSNVAITTMFAYPLSNRNLPGRNFFSFFVFFTMLFSGGLIPTYLVYTQALHIKDTLWALIVPRLLMSGFSIILVRTYLTTNIPTEILDASYIDGASDIYTFVKVVLPLSLPILATVGFMSGLAYWNDWQNGLYYLVKRTDLFTIQNLLNRILSSADALRNSSTNEMMAAGFEIPSVGSRMAISVFAMLPMLIAYPFFQKGFVKGITIGGVKG
jgi:putative aldouronate transport system permease protein